MKRCILIVEDDENDFFLLKKACERTGLEYELQWVRDGQEAAEFLRRKRVSDVCLIVSDIKMPKLNGFEFLELVKQDGVLRTIPFVIFSSSRRAADRERAKEKGADLYIVKPIRFDEMVVIVKALDSMASANPPKDSRHRMNRLFEKLKSLRFSMPAQA